MASLNNLPNISKAPKIIDLDPNQLPIAQRNELLPVITQTMMDSQSSPPDLRPAVSPQALAQASLEQAYSPLKSMDIIKALMPEGYIAPTRLNDPRIMERYKNIIDAMNNYNVTPQQLQAERDSNLQNQYIASALGAKPISGKTNSQLQAEALSSLYKNYQNMSEAQRDMNEQQQIEALNKAGLPLGSIDQLWKNYINPSMQSYSNYENLIQRGNQQQQMEQMKQESPEQQIENNLKVAQTEKILNELSKVPEIKLNATQQKEVSDYANMVAMMPSLEANVNKLIKLSKTASYTPIQASMDTLRRSLGQPVSKGAVQKQEIQAMVDNQILPLLRSTFGAQFTQKEGESLRASMVDVTKSPTEKEAILNSFIAQKRANMEAKQRALELQGISSTIKQPAPNNIPIGKRQYNPKTGQYREWDGTKWQIK